MYGLGTSITFLEKLGSGAYGTVKKASDENGNIVAVKTIPMDKIGIPNILEASIMSTIKHPYLGRAIRIHSNSENLYIIQELADYDLSKYTRRNKMDVRPKIDELRKWCHSISLAVHCLHTNQKIIHCDIKASNCLLFRKQDRVVLTDFSLSVMKIFPDETFSGQVCTVTHRPIECWMDFKEGWDFSLDIWSLACTFYEIAFGELLFPYQGDAVPKKFVTDATIASMLTWAKSHDKYAKEMDCPMVTFIPTNQSKLLDEPEYIDFKDLLMKMLKINPRERIDITTVLSHPFFKEQLLCSFSIIKSPKGDIDTDQIIKEINTYATSIEVALIAKDIYSKCKIIPITFDKKLLARSSVWIALKITREIDENENVFDKEQIKEILPIERVICHHLSYRVHIF